MTKLKLGPLADDKPVKLALELPAAVHRVISRSSSLSNCRPRYIAIWSRMPRCLAASQAKSSLIRLS
jgi:hypothetical protein